MKKYLFAAAVLAAVAAPAAQAKPRPQMRNEFVRACTQSAPSGSSALLQQIGKQYGTRWTATLDAYDRTGNDPQFESRMRRNTEACINRHLNRR